MSGDYPILSTSAAGAPVYYVDATTLREASFAVEPLVLRALAFLLQHDLPGDESPERMALLNNLHAAIERRAG